MPDLWMGPDLFRFEQVVIERLLKPGQPGNYALGFKDESGQFIPKYIGRSDYDLRAEMIAKLGVMRYPYFKFSAVNPRIAFETECAQFHNYGKQLDNKTHPARPAGSDLRCFLCGL
jgi:hypothetical protein